MQEAPVRALASELLYYYSECDGAADGVLVRRWDRGAARARLGKEEGNFEGVVWTTTPLGKRENVS